jgi:transcriptional regulator GlxA family with amidase domain
MEMFNAAHLALGSTSKSLDLYTFATEQGPILTTGGLNLFADYSFSEAPDVDWIFLPPMWGSPWKVLQSQGELLIWLRSKYANGTRIVATGTGVGIAAMAGLLDQRVATTHWYYLPRFRKRFNQVRFQTDHFITHEDGIYCAGSINAQTDLVLFFIEKYFGEDALALVEQQFMHELKRNFSTPYYEPGGQLHDDEVVSLVQSWLRSHLSESITMKQLTEVSGQSERQLRRRFSRATNESPMSYLLRIRIEEAQSLLRETNLTVTDIAHAVGFNGSAYFAKAFKKITSISAIDYRKMVRKKAFSAG